MLATGLAFALLSDVAATAPASWALKRIDLADCNDAAHSALSVFLHSVHDPDSDIVAGVVERSTSPSYFLHLHSQQITKQLRKCSFTDTTYLNTDFCMEIYPRLRSISHDVVAKADKSKNSSKTTRCHARPELDFGSSIKEQTNESRRPQSGSAPYVSGWIRSKSVLLVRQCGCLSTAVILSWAWMQQILSKGKGETPDTSDMAHALGCLVWQHVSWDVLALFRLDRLLDIVLSLDALFAPGLSHCQRELR